jgi:hypothetical protein
MRPSRKYFCAASLILVQKRILVQSLYSPLTPVAFLERMHGASIS